MAILVTGGAGFIGRNFITQIRDHNDEEIINLDLLTYSADKKDASSLGGVNNYTFYQGDIADEQLVFKILQKHNVRAIINFAAETHVDRSILNPTIFIQTNVLGTMKLITAAKRYWDANNECEFRFLHVSTDEVYGDLLPEEKAFTEENPFKPNSPYAASKAASDCIVRSYWKTYGFPVIISNCSNNYGPYQYPEKLIPLIINNCLNNVPLPIYGTGQQVRDWLHVHDHCDALRIILDKGIIGETYNIGGDSEFQNIEVVQSICDVLNDIFPKKDGNLYEELIKYTSDRAGHDQRYAINFTKLTNELGWRPKVKFINGIRNTVMWYLNNEWLLNSDTKEYREWVEFQYKKLV